VDVQKPRRFLAGQRWLECNRLMTHNEPVPFQARRGPWSRLHDRPGASLISVAREADVHGLANCLLGELRTSLRRPRVTAGIEAQLGTWPATALQTCVFEQGSSAATSTSVRRSKSCQVDDINSVD
jgi:hypothetical protein